MKLIFFIRIEEFLIGMIYTSVLMGSIKAPMLVEDLGMGMRILKGFDIQEDGKSAFLKRLSVAITAPTNRSAS